MVIDFRTSMNNTGLLDTAPGLYHHAGHTRKASRISKAAVDNYSKGMGNFYLS